MSDEFTTWTKTGTSLVEISVGDNPAPVDDGEGHDIGWYSGLCQNKSYVVKVDYQADGTWNYVHFNYGGGTGFSLRMPMFTKEES